LASAEDDAYAHIREIYRQEIDRAVSGCKTVEAYNGTLQALLRLRLCNHGTYEHHSREYGATLSSDPAEALTLLQQSDNASCAYCSCDVAVVGEPNNPQLVEFTVCSHLLCNECLPQYEADLKETKVVKEAQCQLCENVIVGSSLVSKEKSGRKNAARSPSSPASPDPFDVNGGHSTKLLAALTKSRTQLENLESPDRCSAIRLPTSVNEVRSQT